METVSEFGLPYWLDIERPVFPRLEQDISADVAIIGAGLCGLKVAYYLAQQGVRSVILEGAQVGSGASGRNQGSINHGGSPTYAKTIERHSRPTAKALWQLGLENHRLLRQQIEQLDIACDYQRDGFVFLARRDLPSGEEALQAYQNDCRLLDEDGFESILLDKREASALGGSDRYLGGFIYDSDAQFHAGKYVVGLGQGVSSMPNVSLFEDTRVTHIERIGNVTKLKTPNATVTAPTVFLGTNALVPQFVPHLERGLRAERGQVFVTAPLDKRPCRGSFGTDMAWWREIIESDGRFRLLFGGGRARDEANSLFPQFDANGDPHPLLESAGFSHSAEHQARLDEQFALLFPQLTGVPITHRWGGLQSFVADSFPQVGLFDAERSIYGIAGLCGRGNCYSDVAAAYLAGKIAGVEHSVEQRFGTLFESILAVNRPTAGWGEWQGVNQ